MPKVTFQYEDGTSTIVDVTAGENLLEVARKANVAIDAPCSGNGSCGKCRVRYISGELESEQTRHITDEDYAAGWRLSCCSKVTGDVTVLVPDIASAYKSRMKVADLSSPEEVAIFDRAKQDVADAGITFENTGKAEILKNRPEIFQKLVDIMDQVERTEDDNDCLYPCTWISDALALGKYHTGSNICVWKAFQSMAEICGEVFHDVKKYSHYTQKAEQLKMAIDEEMTVTVGGKRQYLEGIGGTGNSQKMWIWEENYRKPFLDTALVFLQDVVEDGKINLLMHDGEESDTTLMPFYGYCDYFDDLYRNFMNFTVTENPTYDAEIKGIRWGAMSGATFPGFISALSVAENEEEFRGKEGRLTELLRLADVDGSWWWWPYGVESHRGEVSRSNGCGKCAWASGVFAVMYITQFLGIKHDGIRKETEVSPMKFQGKFKWENSPFERDTMIGGTNNV